LAGPGVGGMPQATGGDPPPGRGLRKSGVEMGWHGLLLLAAIACEILATGLLKRSDGMTRPWPTVGMLAGYVAALALLSLVLKSLPVGPVYAVWSGLGTAATALVGYWAFGDRLPPGAWLGLVLVVLGVALLALYMPHTD
jgi:small multidrug resistance pump